MANGDNKVVKLRQPSTPQVAGSSDPINPKSLLNMTDVEQDMFLNELRERRLRAARILKEAQAAKAHASSIAAGIKLERKADQAQRQLDKVTKALDKLEEIIYDLRALHLQYTDVDITKST